MTTARGPNLSSGLWDGALGDVLGPRCYTRLLLAACVRLSDGQELSFRAASVERCCTPPMSVAALHPRHDCSQEVIRPEPLGLGCGSPSACSELGLWSLREKQRWPSSLSALLFAPVSQKTLSQSFHMLTECLLCAQHCASSRAQEWLGQK